MSNILRIEVFPYLEISPPELLLSPSMSHTLRVTGGPNSIVEMNDGSYVDITFMSHNTTVATIDPITREVTGHYIGDTELTYTISQQRPTL